MASHRAAPERAGRRGRQPADHRDAEHGPGHHQHAGHGPGPAQVVPNAVPRPGCAAAAVWRRQHHRLADGRLRRDRRLRRRNLRSCPRYGSCCCQLVLTRAIHFAATVHAARHPRAALQRRPHRPQAVQQQQRGADRPRCVRRARRRRQHRAELELAPQPFPAPASSPMPATPAACRSTAPWSSSTTPSPTAA